VPTVMSLHVWEETVETKIEAQSANRRHMRAFISH
jgi:hypothetical protein